MEIKCPMYMWDGFSGLEKHVEMLYTFVHCTCTCTYTKFLDPLLWGTISFLCLSHILVH